MVDNCTKIWCDSANQKKGVYKNRSKVTVCQISGYENVNFVLKQIHNTDGQMSVTPVWHIRMTNPSFAGFRLPIWTTKEIFVGDWVKVCQLLPSKGVLVKNLPKKPKRPQKPKLKEIEEETAGNGPNEEEEGLDDAS